MLKTLSAAEWTYHYYNAPPIEPPVLEEIGEELYLVTATEFDITVLRQSDGTTRQFGTFQGYNTWLQGQHRTANENRHKTTSQDAPGASLQQKP